MSTITQTISSYIGGISQQPDELKFPGQLKDAVNVLPDVTQGLLKRPGGRLIASLSDNGTSALNSTSNGRWFSYYRDEAEQYIGQITRTGDVNIWRCSDGAPQTVNFDSGTASALASYLTHSTQEDIQTLTLNDFTYVTNRTKTVAMSSTVKTARPPECYVDMQRLEYARQYSLNLFDNTNKTTTYTATRITVKRDYDSSNACNSSNLKLSEGNLPTGGYYCKNVNGDQQGWDSYYMQDPFCPNVATRIFAITHGGSGDPTDANATNHTYSVSANGGSASDRKNLYFRITTTGQSVPQGGNISNPDYNCRYTTTHDLLYGGEGWRTGDIVYVWMKNARYKITVSSHSTTQIQCNLAKVRPQPTPFDNQETVTAEQILGDIESGIIADGNFTDANIQLIGTGLYITRSSGAFNATTPVKDLLTVIGSTIQDIQDLPRQCKHGYIVKVSNSESTDQDDYYVEFKGNNDKDGDGVWEECAAPGRNIEFDKATMPIQIKREANGTFTVEQVTWDNALVGDTITNPEPSFVGQKINKMLFFRNRMVMLSDENVILSKPGDFFNFWAKSAITFSATDVIDISASSNTPAIVYDGLQINAGLLIFTKNQQFMLTTDSDVLSPQTAKLNAISTYNFNVKTSPISLGTTVGFLDNAGKHSRFFETTDIRREGEPNVLEQSKVVSKLFNKDLNVISNSRENATVFFSERDSDTIYCYRYHANQSERLMQSWFKWTLSGNAQYHTVLDDALYVVVRSNSKDTLQRFDIRQHSVGHEVTDDFDTTTTDDDITYRVHLDNSKIITASQLGYSATTGRTGFTKPDGFNSSKQLVVYCHKADTSLPNPDPSTDAQDSDLIGSYALASVVDTNIEWDGDWTDHDIIVGYLFDYEVKFPTIHYTRQEGKAVRSLTQGSLVVHRVRLNLGNSGLYETIIERTGKPTYTETWEPAKADTYHANQVDFLEEVTQVVPTYEKNTNLSITLKSSHPSPATLHSMSWEGDYNTKFYQRV